jgi:hypothetical protein
MAGNSEISIMLILTSTHVQENFCELGQIQHNTPFSKIYTFVFVAR